MEEWKSYKLVDFIEFNPTISLKKGTLARKITMDQLTPHSRDIYSWGYEPYSGGAKFQNGDTIMARITPCLENGKHAFISLLDEGETAYGSTEYIVMRGKPGISDNRFVYYLSHYPDFKNAAIKSMVGSSGRQRAQVDVLKNLEFYLPGLEEQKQIADTLSALDDKIALNNRINHNLEEQAKALYKSWFIDFEPFKDGKFIDSDLGLIPEGWVVQTLGRIVENRKKSINPQRFPDTVFTHYSLPAFDNSKEPEVQCGSEIMSNKFVVENKMVLFSKLNPRIKRLWVLGDVPENSICSTEFIAYKAHEESMHPFVWCYLNSDSFYDSILSMVNGATGSHQRFHADDTMSFTLPFNQDVALRFSKLIAPLLYSILKNEAENRSLKCERDFLLPRMMSGTLHIGD